MLTSVQGHGRSRKSSYELLTSLTGIVTAKASFGLIMLVSVYNCGPVEAVNPRSSDVFDGYCDGHGLCWRYYAGFSVRVQTVKVVIPLSSDIFDGDCDAAYFCGIENGGRGDFGKTRSSWWYFNDNEKRRLRQSCFVFFLVATFEGRRLAISGVVVVGVSYGPPAE